MCYNFNMAKELTNIQLVRTEIPSPASPEEANYILVVAVPGHDDHIAYFRNKWSAQYFLNRAHRLGFWAQIAPGEKGDWGYIPYQE